MVIFIVCWLLVKARICWMLFCVNASLFALIQQMIYENYAWNIRGGFKWASFTRDQMKAQFRSYEPAYRIKWMRTKIIIAKWWPVAALNSSLSLQHSYHSSTLALALRNTHSIFVCDMKKMTLKHEDTRLLARITLPRTIHHCRLVITYFLLFWLL